MTAAQIKQMLGDGKIAVSFNGVTVQRRETKRRPDKPWELRRGYDVECYGSIHEVAARVMRLVYHAG